MTNKHSEQKLQELYQARKCDHSAPTELKDGIVRLAKQQKASPWRWFTFQSAIAFCCLVVVLGHWSKDDPTPLDPAFQLSQSVNSDNQAVYFIEVALESVENKRHREFDAADSLQLQYQSALAKLQQGQQLRGTVSNTQDGLEIQICQLGKVQISEQIAHQLRQEGLLKTVEPGQDVLLLANEEGRIFSIENAPAGPSCKALGQSYQHSAVKMDA